MDTLSITEIWRWLKWLPKYVLRKIFTPKRLSDLVLFDVRARHDSVSVNLCEHPTCDIWFQIVNMTPYEIELEAAEFIFICAGVEIKIQHVKREVYKSGAVASLHVREDLPEGKANSIAKYLRDNNSSIDVHCDFSCSLHRFSKATHRLEGVSVKCSNESMRRTEVPII
ncbi:hypothetical protein ACJJID_08700 [Microbulbifer sp. CnH-101-G]|uniref:hypothetical protein n=1 Tax=Microbulbifer sp. CnH-101-G TaxID=3243393 RepID=UPI004039760A